MRGDERADDLGHGEMVCALDLAAGVVQATDKSVAKKRRVRGNFQQEIARKVTTTRVQLPLFLIHIPPCSSEREFCVSNEQLACESSLSRVARESVCGLSFSHQVQQHQPVVLHHVCAVGRGLLHLGQPALDAIQTDSVRLNGWERQRETERQRDRQEEVS